MSYKFNLFLIVRYTHLKNLLLGVIALLIFKECKKIMEKRSPLSQQQQEASFYHDSNEVRLAVLSVKDL